jgi:hypothetical protein
MTTQYYKLVLPSFRDGLYSATVHKLRDRVTYCQGRWTYPNTAARHKFLFVFTSRAKARLFKNTRIYSESYQIFKCEVKNPTTIRRGFSWAGSPFVVSDADAGWPKGTVFVDCVKLTEKTH